MVSEEPPPLMKTTLMMVGRSSENPYASLIADYASRVNHYMPFETVILNETKSTRSTSESQQKATQGEQLLRRLSPSHYVVLLDERGKQLSSTAFASWLGKRQVSGRPLVFIIGGAYGFSPEVYRRADEQLSLSLMTFSHRMVRLIFMEQLYRACTIIHGEHYHHE